MVACGVMDLSDFSWQSQKQGNKAMPKHKTLSLKDSIITEGTPLIHHNSELAAHKSIFRERSDSFLVGGDDMLNKYLLTSCVVKSQNQN